MSAPPSLTGQRLCFAVTEDWYFFSHWIGVAVAARQQGAEVMVATRVREHRPAIEAAGIEVLPWRIVRRSAAPWREARAIGELGRWYRRRRPTILHHVGLKPILYGAVAARRAGVGVPRVSAFGGLGSSYIGDGWGIRTWRALLEPALRWAVRGGASIVLAQNADDAAVLMGAGVVASDRLRVIPGEGIDLRGWRVVPEPPGVPLVVLAGRLLRDKGVHEFVAAARQLRGEGVSARFALVGRPDPENPGAVTPHELGQWQREGAVEVWGYREDMEDVLAQSAVVCLPSYREGLPRLLVEAAAAGRPAVATDVPGCRQAVRHQETGILVRPRDVQSLAGALRELLGDPARRARLGAAARGLAEREFAESIVIGRLLALYHDLVRTRGTGRPTRGKAHGRT